MDIVLSLTASYAAKTFPKSCAVIASFVPFPGRYKLQFSPSAGHKSTAAVFFYQSIFSLLPFDLLYHIFLKECLNQISWRTSALQKCSFIKQNLHISIFPYASPVQNTYRLLWSNSALHNLCLMRDCNVPMSTHNRYYFPPGLLLT